ncbi:sugar ABC transporter substrate-binding protein [Microbacterium sp. LWH3-1.2]|uniref:sugar ABC transporter substrate-binding protein n=1 Tax=Microbacterium sp. LWH3-1.2 TaxID=3135256 RepID=UPI0034267E75
MPTSAHPYVSKLIDNARLTLEEDDFSVTVIENNFDQAEQDTQVQQYLASGDKPAGILWFPSDAQASIASLSRLSGLGVPIVQVNQRPLPESEDYFTAFAGISDLVAGENIGNGLIAARDAMEADGKQLHSPGGNVLVVTGPVGFGASIDRITGFEEATAGAGFNVLATINSPALTPDATYTEVSQSLQGPLAEGIDLVFTFNDDVSTGTLRALTEAGLTPGVDVAVSNGVCNGRGTATSSGDVFSTVAQSPEYEGTLSASVLKTLIGNGGELSDEETHQLPDDADAVPDLSFTPAKYNYVPLPPIMGAFDDPAASAENVAAFKLWGQGVDTLCDF